MLVRGGGGGSEVAWDSMSLRVGLVDAFAAVEGFGWGGRCGSELLGLLPAT